MRAFAAYGGGCADWADLVRAEGFDASAWDWWAFPCGERRLTVIIRRV
jgi:hypothetical protein